MSQISRGTCPRCLKSDVWVGPWSGEGPGGHRVLCGACKLRIMLKAPGFRSRFAKAMGVAESDVTVYDPDAPGAVDVKGPGSNQ